MRTRRIGGEKRKMEIIRGFKEIFESAVIKIPSLIQKNTAVAVPKESKSSMAGSILPVRGDIYIVFRDGKELAYMQVLYSYSPKCEECREEKLVDNSVSTCYHAVVVNGYIFKQIPYRDAVLSIVPARLGDVESY